MQICGIIAEYNPFHSGHAYHIAQTREKGASHIAVVMSTSFVQRGEPAAFDLLLRAKSALDHGADLVAALPAVYSMSGAGVFCRAGIETLSLLGCNAVSFGCETPEQQLFTLKTQCEQALHAKQFADCIERGMHFARARAEAVKALFGSADALNDANTALALGYLAANDVLDRPMQPVVIPRVGVSHDALSPESGFASASYLRQHPDGWKRYLPDAKPYQAVRENGRMTDLAICDRVLTALLKGKTLPDWEQTAGVSEGLFHTLYAASQRAMSAEEILMACKSKRYPLSALRRILWSCALGITGELQKKPVPGVWIIGANDRGYEILANARKCRKEQGLSQIVTPKFADFAQKNPELAAVEQRAADLRELCCPKPARCDLYRSRLQ